jgi:plastocyanin
MGKIDEAKQKFGLHEPTVSTLSPEPAAAEPDTSNPQADQPGTSKPETSQSQTTAPKTEVISILSGKFDKPEVTISVNDSVEWVNKDTTGTHQIASDPHPTHYDLPGLESGALGLNQSFKFTFKEAGTFTYHDHLNPSLTGVVIVK